MPDEDQILDEEILEEEVEEGELPSEPEVPPAKEIVWLRKLLEDPVAYQQELVSATGTQLVFLVRNPPIVKGTDKVYVNGLAKVNGTDYTIEEGRKIVFKAPAPGLDEEIQIEYGHQTWEDEELELYLEQANKEWYQERHVVYQAFIYAVESIMFGLATGLNFGSGDEKFDIASVYTRLTERVDKVRAWLEQQKDEPYLTIFDMVFDVDDPEYPGDWENFGSLTNPDLIPPVI